MIIQVHDELLFDVCDDEKTCIQSIIQSEMESVGDLAVPLEVDYAIARNWRDCEA